MDQLNTRNKENLFINTCLTIQQAFVVDNTNPIKLERSRYIKFARSKRFKVIGYYFKSDPALSIERNANRVGKENIPDIGIRGTYKKLQIPTMDEGFDELFYVEIEGNDFTITKPDNET